MVWPSIIVVSWKMYWKWVLLRFFKPHSVTLDMGQALTKGKRTDVYGFDILALRGRNSGSPGPTLLTEHTCTLRSFPT